MTEETKNRIIKLLRTSIESSAKLLDDWERCKSSFTLTQIVDGWEPRSSQVAGLAWTMIEEDAVNK